MKSTLVKNVPLIMQMEATECGAACLAMVLAHYGRWITLEQARQDCGVSRDGSKVVNVLRAARAYGMEADAYRCTMESMQVSEELPAILFWNFTHFVVLCGFKGKYAYLNDPARGTVKVTLEEFDRSFTGIVLRMRPTEAFERGGAPKSVVSFASERLQGMTGSLVFIALCCAVVSLSALIYSSSSSAYLDHVLNGESPGWLAAIVTIMSIVILGHLAASIMCAYYINRVRGRFAVVGSSRFMWHLLHLPVGFYQQRNIGDLQHRQASNETVAYTLVEQLAPACVNALMLVVYLVVMLGYSWKLTLVALVSVTLDAVAAYIASRTRLNLTRQKMRQVSLYSGTTMAGIESIEAIKASGAEQGFFERWSGCQALVVDAEARFARASMSFAVIPQLLAQLGNIAVLILGTYLIMTGELSTGMLLAFQGMFKGFLSPVNQIVGMGQRLQEMRSDMERIEDVLGYPCDVSPEPMQKQGVSTKLSGEIELDHVSFGYSRLDPPLIKDFSLRVEPGKWVALVGASGSGKSTIAKILVGLHDPWEGEVRYDGRPLREIEPERLRGSVSLVDQDISVFEDTIGENIRLWDRSIKDFEVILAARDAGLLDDIMARDAGLDARVMQGGRNLSGGQLQRLEIARALASGPSVLVLDEATSALDARTESEVIAALRLLGLTCVVVAHRLSTIRSCDEIVVLDAGEVVERGTHDELIACDGAYAHLVRND